MQFGRLTGGALAFLGILLLALQLSFSLASKTQKSPPVDPAANHTYRDFPFPAILGGALVIGGFIIFVTARRRDEPDARHAIR
jgi:hypothetical protein